MDPFLTVARILTFLDTVDYIATESKRNQLRAYIRTKLSFKYSGQDFQDIVENLRLDRGAFGYRINMRAMRAVLNSETPSPDDPSIPNLVALQEGGINVCADLTPRRDAQIGSDTRLSRKGSTLAGGGSKIDSDFRDGA